MKILHTVEYYYPNKGGVQEVVKQLSERLVEMGHQVTVATKKLKERTEFLVNGVEIVEFDIAGNYIRGFSGNINEYTDYLINSDFDIITNFAAQQFATDLALPILDKIKGKKVFVPTGFSALYSDSYKDYFENMKIWQKSYDANVFLSNDYRDIKFARDNNILNQIIIPNGASEEEFLKEYSIDIRKDLSIKKDSFLILSIGSHTGAKGHDESIEIFSKAKIKNATLVINGNTLIEGESCFKSCSRKVKKFNLSLLRKIDNKKIILTNLNRDKLVPLLKDSQLFLFPSNIECSPIVLFESMAAKVPFLTSEAGNSAEIIEWSKGGILLPTGKYFDNGNLSIDIKKSTSILESIFKDKQLRNTLANNGFKSWEDKFTWSKIANDYSTLYNNLLSNNKIDFIEYKLNSSETIDVVIPTYNHGKYILNAIKSVENQTYKPSRIIVINDGSTDDTDEILRSYKSSVELLYIKQENSGLSSARNAGIKLSTAEYIAFLDADDAWNPEKLESQLDVFKKSGLKNLGVVYCNYSIMDSNGENIRDAYRFEIDPKIRGDIFLKILESNKVSSSGSGVLVKKEIFDKVGNFDTNLSALEDWDMWLRISKEFSFDYTQKTLVKIRRHSDNMQKDTSRMFINELKFMNLWVNRISKDLVPLSWEFSLANQIIGKFPDVIFLRLALNHLTKKSRSFLFKEGYGSMRIYLLKRQLSIYKGIFIYNAKEFLRLLRNIFVIFLKR